MSQVTRLGTTAFSVLVLSLLACADHPSSGEDAGPLQEAEADAGTREDAGSDPLDAGEDDAGLPDAGFDGGQVSTGTFGEIAAPPRCLSDEDCSGARASCNPLGACSSCGGPDCATTEVWSTSFTASAGPSAIASLRDRVEVAGVLTSSIDFGGGLLTSASGKEPWYAEFGPDAEHLRSFKLPSSGSAEIQKIEVGPQGERLLTGRALVDVTVAGARLEAETVLSGLPFVALIDNAGNLAWSKVFDTAEGELRFATLTSNGDILLAGYLQHGKSLMLGGQTLVPSDLAGNGWLARISSAGTLRWITQTPPRQRVSQIDLAPDDGFVISGELTFEGDFGGGVLRNDSSYSVFVVRYDGAGQHVWSHRYPEPGNNVLQAFNEHFMAVGPTGEVAFSSPCDGLLEFAGGGSLDAGFDAARCVIRLDATGQYLGGLVLPRGVRPRGLAIDAWNRALVAGQFNLAAPVLGASQPPPALTPFVLVLGPDGSVLRSHVLDASNDSTVTAVALDDNGELVMSGLFSGTLEPELQSQVPAIWINRFVP